MTSKTWKLKMFTGMTLLIAFLVMGDASAILPIKSLGGMDSGGGRGYVCFKNKDIAEKVRKHQGLIDDEDLDQITFLEPLDLFEARQKRGVDVHSPILAGPLNGENHLEYLERLINRIETVFPTLGERVRRSEFEFMADNLIWQEMALMPVMDENTAGSYQNINCALTTMAVQFKEEGQNYLTIDHRLFYHEKHSTMGRAVLLLHEYMYLVARKTGRADSRSTRLAIGMLLRNESNLSLVEMEKELVNLHFILPGESLGENPDRPTYLPPLSNY